MEPSWLAVSKRWCVPSIHCNEMHLALALEWKMHTPLAGLEGQEIDASLLLLLQNTERELKCIRPDVQIFDIQLTEQLRNTDRSCFQAWLMTTTSMAS